MENINNIVTKIEPEVVVTDIKENSAVKKNYNLIRLIIGIIIAILGLYVDFNNSIVNKILIILSYIILSSLSCCEANLCASHAIVYVLPDPALCCIR